MIETYFLYIAGFSCSFAILAYLFKLRRLYGKVWVNCWFCNQDVKVQYKFFNSFVCPHCDQYNGFKEDGDYNCIIEEQHLIPSRSSLDKKSPKRSPSKSNEKFDNGFCEPCNLNQALKIRALAEFSAVSSDENEEVDKFKERLEEIYGLCQHCQATVNQTLGKQNSWLKPLLISWRLIKSKEIALRKQPAVSGKSWFGNAFSYFVVIINTLLCLLSLETFAPDVVKPYKEKFIGNSTEMNITYKNLVFAGTALQMGLIFLVKSNTKKILKIFSFVIWIIVLLMETKKHPINDNYLLQCKIALNILNLACSALIAMNIFEKSYTKRSKKMSLDEPFNSDSFLLNEPRSSSPLNTSFESSLETRQTKTPKIGDENKDQDILDTHLLSLKISTPKKVDVSNFSPQNLFRGSSSNKNVLQPSKLGKHFITQSSWVAGGYWGSPGSPQRSRLTRQNVSHLEEIKSKPDISQSRSSSQSSGFVSQFSDCASSRSHHAGIQNVAKPTTHSHQSSVSGEPGEKVSIFTSNHNNGSVSFGSLRPHSALDTFDAQSACSVSSYYSDNSQLRYRPPSQPNFYHNESSLYSFSPDKSHNMLPYTNTFRVSYASYFNLGIAFILGLSVSANLFLVFLLWHNDMLVK
ncbi:UNVERIFIED_CONTAM: hypothetical protein RMT77_000476 [Armadillidium vulgare]